MDILKTTILPYINFTVFMFILIAVIKKPLSSIFRERKEKFLSSSKAAEAKKSEATSQHQELTEKMKNLDMELDKIKIASIQSAEQQASELIIQAEKLAENIRNEAKKVGEAEVQKAKRVLQNQLMKNATKMVEEKIEKEFDKPKQLAFMEQELNKVNTAPAN